MLNILEVSELTGFTQNKLIGIVTSDDCPGSLTPENPNVEPIFWQFSEAGVKSYVKQSIERQGQALVLESKQLDTFLSWCMNQGDSVIGQHSKVMRCVVGASHFTGMRVAEIAKLKLSDVVNDDWSLKKETLLTKNMAKRNKPRKVLLSHSKFVPILQYHVNTRRNEGAKMDDYLIVSNRGNNYTRQYLAGRYSAVFERFGMQDVSSHSGRRFFITEMLSKGVPIKVAQILAGHTDAAMTARYHEPREAEYEEALALIG